MEKYVLTIQDDVCASNGKDPAATELLEKMKLWGKVEPLDKVLAEVRAEYQTSIDNLKTQLDARKAHALTEDEIRLLITYRELKAALGADFQARIDELEQNALKTAEDLQKKATLIRELFPEA